MTFFVQNALGPAGAGGILARQDSNTGLLSGGVVTLNTVTSVDISAGSGQVTDYTDPTNVVFKTVSWPAQTNVAITTLATDGLTEIGFDVNAAIVQFKAENEPANNSKINIIVGFVAHSSGSISVVGTTPGLLAYGGKTNFNDFFTNVIGPANVTGNIYGPNGVNLSLDVQGGIAYMQSANFRTDFVNPDLVTFASGSVITFARSFRQADPVNAIQVDAITTLVDPTRFDDGSGTLQTVPATEWTVQRIYTTRNGLHAVAFGQETFTTQADAVIGIGNTVQEKEPQPDALLRGFLVVIQSATDLSNAAQAEFRDATSFRIGGQAGATGGAPGVTTPGAPDTSIQFNNAGIFGGDADLTYNSTTNNIALNGTLNGLEINEFANVNFRIGNSLGALTSGTDNIIVGEGSGNAITTGPDNTVFGHNSATALNTGDNNIVVGNDSLNAATGSIRNVTIGTGTAALFTGNDSIFIGSQNSTQATAGNDLIMIGVEAGPSNAATTGSNSVGIGSFALSNMTASSNSVAIGARAFEDLTTGVDNVAVGSSSGASLTSGAGCVFIGNNTAGTATVGNDNLIIGSNSASSLTIGSNNIIIGSNTDIPSGTISNWLSIRGGLVGDTTLGCFAFGNSLTSVNSFVSLALEQTDKAFLPNRLTTTQRDALTAVAGMTLYNSTLNELETYNGTSWAITGDNPGAPDTSIQFNNGGAFGGDADLTYNSTTNTLTLNGNINGVELNEFATDNIRVGTGLGSISTGDNNVVVGNGAGLAITTGSNNSLFGNNAGVAIDIGNSNTIFGAFAGDALVSGNTNTLYGANSGGGLTTGSLNIYIGNEAADDATTGSGNIVIGNTISIPGIADSNRFNLADIIRGDLSAFSFGDPLLVFETASVLLESKNGDNDTPQDGGIMRTRSGKGANRTTGNMNGANGGQLQLTGGDGGTGGPSGGFGGAGSAVILQSGIGGATSAATGTGGVGGTLDLFSGQGGGGPTVGTNAGAGGAILVTAGSGGSVQTSGSGSLGASGGNITFNPGDASNTSSESASPAGNGGNFTINMGSAGNGATDNVTGGNAGDFIIVGRPGGNGFGTGDPGTGSDISLTSGKGGTPGASSATNVGGGTITVTSGAGGDGNATATGGAGGNIAIDTGIGGADGGAGAGAGGTVLIGTQNATEVEIGDQVNTNNIILEANDILIANGAFAVNRKATAGNTVTTDETIIGVTNTAAARTVTIQTAFFSEGKLLIIKDESGGAGTNNITIDTQGAETIDGAASVAITVNFGVARIYMATASTAFLF